jgi:hypothetical protein
MRQTEKIRRRRWASPAEAEEIIEGGRSATMGEYENRIMKAEREVDQNRNELRNAERRVRKTFLCALSLSLSLSLLKLPH